jgi:hypothetical protein
VNIGFPNFKYIYFHEFYNQLIFSDYNIKYHTGLEE